MDGLSLLESFLGHKAKICISLEVNLEIVDTGTFKTYNPSLKSSLLTLGNIYKRLGIMFRIFNKYGDDQCFGTGHLVYMYLPRGIHLKTGIREIMCKYFAPLLIYRTKNSNQFIF